MIKIGPSGSWGNIEFDEEFDIDPAYPFDEKGKTEIYRVYISYDDTRVRSIQFLFVEEDGKSFSSSLMYGGKGASFETITLDYPSEAFTSVTGRYDDQGICSITLGTNLRSYGPFGKTDNVMSKGERPYTMRFEPAEFGGFHGNSDLTNLRAIGVYIKPTALTSTSSSSSSSSRLVIKSEPQEK